MEFKMEKYISSCGFYSMMNEINNALDSCKPENVLLDFSETSGIEAVVIPNLLFLGAYLRQKTGSIPVIRMGEDLDSGYLKKYLNGINFFDLSDRFYRYENDRYTGFMGRDMDPKNATAYFLQSEGVEIARRRIYYSLLPFIEKYLKSFERTWRGIEDEGSYEQITLRCNIVSQLVEQMVLNSFRHGKSDAIVTVQANYRRRRLYLSISDMGYGFLSSSVQTDGGDQESYDVLGNRRAQTQLDGILYGIYKRKGSRIYGLYNVIRRVFQLQGIVRIHSDDTQVILSGRQRSSFASEQIVNELRKADTRRGRFPGAHIEIEIPMDFHGGAE